MNRVGPNYGIIPDCNSWFLLNVDLFGRALIMEVKRKSQKLFGFIKAVEKT